MFNAKKVLIVAAHPDDEILGCGGTMARLIDMGAHLHVAFLADGVLSREVGQTEQRERIRLRRDASIKACALLGVGSVSFGEFPDNQMDTVSTLSVARAIETLICKHQPDTVLTHHMGDLNIDHQKVAAGVTIACRPQKGHPVKTILSFEVPSSTEWQLADYPHPFVPAVYIDITEFTEMKAAALRAYQEEMRPWPHPRSFDGVLHLQSWRGATVGVEAAEAFALGRHIIPVKVV